MHIYNKLLFFSSHAITVYLATRYGYSRLRRGYLLPKDPGSRARIEQLMHYNSGVLQPKYRVAAVSIVCLIF